jgi:hypothetical protein
MKPKKPYTGQEIRATSIVRLGTNNELFYRKRLRANGSVATFASAIINYSKQRWHLDFGTDKEYVVETGAYYYDLYVPLTRRLGIIVSPYVSVLLRRNYLRQINEQGLALDIMDNSYIPELPEPAVAAIEKERKGLSFSYKKSHVEDVLFTSRSAEQCFEFVINRDERLAVCAEYKHTLARLFAQQTNATFYRVFEDETGYIITHFVRTPDIDAICMKLYKDYNSVLEDTIEEFNKKYSA